MLFFRRAPQRYQRNTPPRHAPMQRHRGDATFRAELSHGRKFKVEITNENRDPSIALPRTENSNMDFSGRSFRTLPAATTRRRRETRKALLTRVRPACFFARRSSASYEQQSVRPRGETHIPKSARRLRGASTPLQQVGRAKSRKTKAAARQITHNQGGGGQDDAQLTLGATGGRPRTAPQHPPARASPSLSFPNTADQASSRFWLSRGLTDCCSYQDPPKPEAEPHPRKLAPL